MKISSNFSRTVRLNSWLIRLRWYGITGVFFSIILSWFLELSFFYPGLIAIFILLVLHNFISSRILKNNIRETSSQIVFIGIQKTLFYQINIDLILLTGLIYFSGGIENPFFLFYFFHIVIASIVLTKRSSYLVNIISILLLTILSGLGYFQFFPFFDSVSFLNSNLGLCQNPYYIVSIIGVFSVTSFIMAYLTGSISTEIQKQEKALMHLNVKLEDANKELKVKDAIKDEYVFRVTHDIKGHLAAIITNLNVIVKRIIGPMPKKQEKFIMLSYNRTLRLQEFVQDLLRITQMRMSNRVETQTFLVNDAIAKSVQACEENAKIKKIKLESDLKQEILVCANQFSVEEVISNLILNAIKYTPEKGEIIVTAIEENIEAKISVTDNGIGISEDEVGLVFNEFFRAKNANEFTTDGTGLGLSLVKQIVTSNNGRVGAASKLGEGSTFYFTLPLGVKENA